MMSKRPTFSKKRKKMGKKDRRLYRPGGLVRRTSRIAERKLRKEKCLISGRRKNRLTNKKMPGSNLTARRIRKV